MKARFCKTFRRDGIVLVISLMIVSLGSAIDAQDVQGQKKTISGQAASNPAEANSARPDDMKKAHEAFRKLLSGSKLVGSFTIVGKKQDLTPEEYTISEVTKMDDGDYWKFKVRIKYMKYDVNVAIPLQVKWAGDTPVITVDGDEIPSLGKFNARVVIHENKYSGTWSHGKVNGHLFGTIERAGESGSPRKGKSGTEGNSQKDK